MNNLKNKDGNIDTTEDRSSLSSNKSVTDKKAKENNQNVIVNNNKRHKSNTDQDKSKATTSTDKHKQIKKKSKVKIKWSWSIKILILTLVLSLSFSIMSEFALSSANIAVAIIVIMVLVVLSVMFDCIGVAVAAADEEPFISMASRKVKGAKESLVLIKNAEKVSSFCCDIVGDICGILSGAAGAAIAIYVVIESSEIGTIILASLVSAVIAALTVFGKSLAKNFAIGESTKIIGIVGKVLSILTFSRIKK